jgi:hypothetical protein
VRRDFLQHLGKILADLAPPPARTEIAVDHRLMHDDLARQVLGHPPPHRARPDRRYRGDRRSPHRRAVIAREPADQGRAPHGPAAHRQDPRQLRLRVPAVARSQPHHGARRPRLYQPCRGHPPPRAGTGKSHLPTALAVEAVRAGRSVYFIPLAELVAALAKAEHEGTLREKIRFLCRCSLLVVDEIGYLPVTPGGGNLFFQLVNARYEKGAMILTSNRGFAEWGGRVRRSRRRRRVTRSAAPSRRRRPDRGLELSHAAARRSHPRTRQINLTQQPAARPQKTRTAAIEGANRSNLRLITDPNQPPPDQGILSAHFCGNFGAH